MKIIKLLIIITFTITSFLSFGQGIEESHIGEANRIDQTISYTLNDFNEKYYLVFKDSYNNGFASFKGQDAKIVDFENGEKESIVEKDGKSTFSVDFYTAMEEPVSIKLLEDITNRILITSPNGFQVEHINHIGALNDEATLIVYNTEHADKSAHQPTILVWIDKNDFTVKMQVREPIK